MHSSGEARLRAAVFAALLMMLSGPAAVAEPAGPRADDGRPQDAEIVRAIEIVKADPNLGTERTIKTLRWKESKGKPWRILEGLSWLGGFFRWLDQSARVLIWCAVAVAAGLLVVYVVRLVRHRVGRRDDGAFVAPTHVRELDIRPESLPPDVGAAARALWDSGEHRGALVLLYRGLLSRLAHVHAVPIRDSSTEGDCLILAARHLTRPRTDYTGRLIAVWQRFAYARESVQGGVVHGLCDEFAAALDRQAMLDGGAS